MVTIQIDYRFLLRGIVTETATEETIWIFFSCFVAEGENDVKQYYDAIGYCCYIFGYFSHSVTLISP